MTLAADVVVVIHLASLAVGLGTVISLDLIALRQLHRPITAGWLTDLKRGHGLIGGALVMLWVSGAGLVALRFGFDPAHWPVKLVAKLATVASLSAVAVAMWAWALPQLQRAVGCPPLALPLARRLGLATVAGVSVAGWSTALCLGAMSVARDLPAADLVWIVLVWHGAIVACAWTAAVWSRPAPQAPLNLGAVAIRQWSVADNRAA